MALSKLFQRKQYRQPESIAPEKSPQSFSSNRGYLNNLASRDKYVSDYKANLDPKGQSRMPVQSTADKIANSAWGKSSISNPKHIQTRVAAQKKLAAMRGTPNKVTPNKVTAPSAPAVNINNDPRAIAARKYAAQQELTEARNPYNAKKGNSPSQVYAQIQARRAMNKNR